jgi:hypothetical protein
MTDNTQSDKPVRIMTDAEMRTFQVRMVDKMFEALAGYEEKILSNETRGLDPYHKAFRNVSRQIKALHEGVLESHRERYHNLFRGEEEDGQ